MMAEHAEELDDGQQQDQQKQEEWHHKRVGEAWREGLHALAQNLKCPICLGLMHSAAVAPCYHFACKQCWDQLLAAASGGGVHSACPMCKGAVSRRTIQECEDYNAMTRALERAIPAFGLAVDDSCNVMDPLEPSKPPPKPFVVPMPRPPPASASLGSARGGTGSRTNNAGGGTAVEEEDEEEEARAARAERDDGPLHVHRSAGRRGSRSSSVLLREADEVLESSGYSARSDGGGGYTGALGAGGMEEMQDSQGSEMEADEQEEEEEEEEEEEDSRAGWGREPSQQFEVGALVEVAARTWPGINKEGGVARVTAVRGAGEEEEHEDGPCYDVKFILTGKHETRIPPRFVRDGAAAVGFAGGAVERGQRAARATRHSLGSPVGSTASGRSMKSGSSASTTRRRGSAPARGETTGRGDGVREGRGGATGRGGLRMVPDPTALAAAPASASCKRPAPSSSPSSAAAAKENMPPPPPPSSNVARNVGSSSLKKKASASTAVQAPRVEPPAGQQGQQEQEHYGPEGDTYVRRPQEMVILPTALPHPLVLKLDEFVARFGGRVVRQPGPEVTHVVGRVADGKRRAESRTIKYLHGVLLRRWLLASSWVTDSLAAGKLELEQKHEMTGDPKAQEPSAPTKARLSRYKRTPGLFRPFAVAFYGDFPPPRPARRDLESLVAAGEGRVLPVQELAAAAVASAAAGGGATKYVVLCNSLPAPGSGAEPSPPALLQGQGQGQGQGPHVVNSDWLLDSASNYRPMPFGKYRVVLPEEGVQG